jgi:hypothetical protein
MKIENSIIMKRNYLLVLSILLLLIPSCQSSDKQLTESQKQEIINLSSEVVRKVFDYSNNLDFESGLNHYSTSSDAYYITDGLMHSLEDLRKSYREIGPSVEGLHNSILSWNVQVVSKDVVNFTLPVDLKLKLKGIPEFSGQLIWTATLQKQKEGWVIIQSHESWLDCAEIADALTKSNDK